MNITKSVPSLSSYSDPEFEAKYQDLENELLVFDVDAKQSGLTNNPVTLKQYKIQVIRLIKSAIQKIIDFNYSRNQMISDMAIAQNLRTTASDNTNVLTKEKNEKNKKLVLLRDEQKTLKKNCKTGISTMVRIIIPSLFGICEGSLVGNMLLSSSFPFIMAFLLASLTTLIASFGLHLGANFICKAKTKLAKRIRFAIVLTIAFLVAYALGVWRADTYGNANDIKSQIDVTQQPATSETGNFSPWPFVIISFMSFLVGLALEIWYWLSDDEKRQLRKYEDKTAEVRKEEQVVRELEKEIKAIKENSDSNSASVLQRQEYACTNEDRLLSLAQNTVSRYESINVEFRKNNQYPDFFGEPVDFGFKLYFTPLFNSIKQKL